MFTHLVTLKRKPWFIYSQDAEDAINICRKYGDDVVGVVLASSGLIMQEVEIDIKLTTNIPKLIDYIVDNENLEIAKEIINEDVTKDNSNDSKSIPEKTQTK